MGKLGIGAAGVCLGAALFAGACGGSSSEGLEGTGGSAASGGSGGSGGGAGAGSGGTSTGGTGGVPLVPSDKIDVLLMIDNSISMADKQHLLGEAVPQLVKRLTTPAVDPTTGKPQFKAVQDIHIGIISSSLGGHGSTQCSESGPAWNPTQNDRAHLIGQLRPGLPSYKGLGFLWWDPNGSAGGETNQANLIATFTEHVKATGENGCGYEAQLESWYRFLVDPTPPEKVVLENNSAKVVGVDDLLLTQREQFLRPDSVVIVMMLTDENDCSIIDGGFNWVAAQTTNPNGTAFHLPRATSVCSVDPDSPCCRSCNSAETSPPAGCGALGGDPECLKGPWDDQGDHPNLRCWHQKKRFGLSFLYPTERYVKALTEPMICPTWTATGPTAGCQLVPNPLLAKRNPGLVFLTGVVGVPWQDLATEDTVATPADLRYMTAAELAAKGRWAWLLPSGPKDQPDDPLMIESTQPRTGTQPSTGAALAPPSAKAGTHPANGHEWNTSMSDLQYACIYRLATPKDCSVNIGGGCDCDDVGPVYNAQNPLCQNPATSAYSKVQSYAKAYPGIRHLEVLKGLGKQAVVGSICPKVTGDPGSASYGYNPVVDVLLTSVAPVLAK